MTEIATKLVVDLSKPVGDPERVQSIPLTQEELDERELMQAQAEAERELQEAVDAEKAALKLSAMQKLGALGLSDAEISSILN